MKNENKSKPPRHTAKSVGLSPAFTGVWDSAHRPAFEHIEGMTYAQWLWGQNVVGLNQSFDAHDSEFGGGFGGTQNEYAEYVKGARLAHLQWVADMLNELEAMPS